MPNQVDDPNFTLKSKNSAIIGLIGNIRFWRSKLLGLNENSRELVTDIQIKYNVDNTMCTYPLFYFYIVTRIYL